MCIIDVGANCGDTTAAILSNSPETRVIAIEGSTYFLKYLRKNFQNLDLLNEKVKFIKGPVEETLEIPQNIPEKISILRLDTDLYSSTKKELECLYPRLSRGGIMMIDDYGYWEGATKAVKEYFAENALTPFLMPISHTGVVLVKQ